MIVSYKESSRSRSNNSRRKPGNKKLRKDKYNLREQFDNWRQTKNKSVLFPSTPDDRFYVHTTKGKLWVIIDLDLQDYTLEYDTKFIQSGDQGIIPKIAFKPHLLNSSRHKVIFNKTDKI